MKKTLWILLSLVALPLHAQSILSTLNQHQNSLEPDAAAAGSPTVKKSGAEVAPKAETSAIGGGKCEENDQTSLPLAYVTSLILAKNGKLDVSYDPHKGIVQVSAPDMIGNCSNMIQWKLKEQVIGGSKVYAVEAQLKQGENCGDNGCEYKVAKVEGGAFKEWERITVKPTLKGFEECLQKAGVVNGGKVNHSGIYSAPLMERFPDIAESGKIAFVSHGPASALVKAKYGKFDTIDKCDYYEPIVDGGKMILSAQDEERNRLDAEASKLKNCSINEYHKVADFLEKYDGYASVLGDVRDKLILEAAKKAAKAIEEGKYTEDDIKVLADFDKYIVKPKAQQAAIIYNELRGLQGAEAEAKKAELKAVLAELKALNGKPYFQASHTKKLMNDGRFDDAEKMNTMKIVLDSYSKLGSTVDKVVVTPEIAANRVHNGRERFLNDLESEKEKYALRTGAETGREAYYRNLARRMRHNIETRTNNYREEIAEEYARMQQGGYCYKYFRNTQKCIQDSMERIQELQMLLQKYNQVDSERAAEYDEKAKEYGKLEAEGRRYIAAQNGEEPPPEQPAEQPKPADTTMPTRRDNNTYNFQYNPQQQMGQQQMGQQQMGQQQPSMFQNMYGSLFQQPQYGNQYGGGYGSPMMGQQAYSGFGGYSAYGYQPQSYNFNYGGAGGYGQQMGYGSPGGYGQPQMGGYGSGFGQPQFGGYGGFQGSIGGYGQPSQGYWGSPYQAYGGYSMYR